MNCRALDKGQRELYGQEHETHQHRKDGNDRHLDDERNEDRSTRRRLESSGITHSATNEVPEELAEDQAPEAGPDSVDARGDGDEARIFMPNEIAHGNW